MAVSSLTKILLLLVVVVLRVLSASNNGFEFDTAQLLLIVRQCETIKAFIISILDITHHICFSRGGYYMLFNPLCSVLPRIFRDTVPLQLELSKSK